MQYLLVVQRNTRGMFASGAADCKGRATFPGDTQTGKAVSFHVSTFVVHLDLRLGRERPLSDMG